MAVREAEHLSLLIIHTESLIMNVAYELWDDKEALGKFLTAVRRSGSYTDLAKALGCSPTRPTNTMLHASQAGSTSSTAAVTAVPSTSPWRRGEGLL
jgi:hypothetical protein